MQLLKARATPGASLPMGILLLVLPIIAVGQFRGIALAATIGFILAITGYWRAHHRLPLPPLGRTLALALLPLLWCLVSATWSIEPGRAISTALTVGGFVLLGAMTAQAVAEEPPERINRMLRLLAWGLGIGIVLAFADHVTGNALRAAMRGLREAPPTLYYGLKPAVSTIALLLPLACSLRQMPRAVRIGLALAGLLTALVLHAEAAKIAVVLGLLVMAGAMWLGPWLARGIGLALAAIFISAPLLFGAILPQLPLERLPPTAAHRVLIWDFVLTRIAERPVLGWGGEASRTIPGGRDHFDTATLDRFGLTSDFSRAWFGQASRLPLHPHNAPLQVWLELGGVGAVLAALLIARLGWLAAASGPAAAGTLAAAATVGMLSYGIWQEWWIGLLLVLVVTFTGANRVAAVPKDAVSKD
ncbi:O-antigen ligase family protein [Roseomonas chloroacetimidivorans]|uniref:O-antigen ligase family protein n=1 Tax=Roseomonas chloroacetimidivorans TaxID=1766656 RepID=UPI003C796294